MSGTVYFVTRGIAPFHGVGGLERASADVVAALRADGLEVVVVAPTSDRFRSTDQQIAVPWPARLPSREIVQMSVGYALWARRVSRALATAIRPEDVLHLNGGTGVTAHHLRKRPLQARVLNPHGMEEFARNSLRDTVAYAWLRRAGRAGARAATAVVATDRSMVQTVEDNLQCGREKIVVVPNAVDTDRLERLATSGRERAGEYVGSAPRVVSIGRLVRNKGYDMMPDVLRELENRWGISVNWVHVGDGPLKAEIQDRAEALGLASSYRILSGLDDDLAQAILASADVFCQPSRYEGSSLTTLEALSHGRACVGTRVGGIPDKLRPGVTGELAEPNSADIAAALARLITQPEMALTCGRAGRRMVHEEFSLSAIAAQFGAVYRRGAAESERVA